MKKFLICILALMAVVFCTSSEALSAQKKVPSIAVISDSSHRNGTNYLICGAAADIIASDIINRMNQTGRMYAPLLGENMSKITQKSIPLYHDTFFKEYKYNYNVDYVNLKRVTRNLNTDYVLMVTSGLDVQSQLLKETWWNKWGLSASEPIVPTYKLTTMLTLVDIKSYRVVWQNLYERNIKADNLDLGFAQFSPNYSQLTKIKKYSNRMSEYVVNNVDKVVNPWIVPAKKPQAIEMKSKFVNEGTKVYYPTVNGEVVKETYDVIKNETKTKINNYKRERQQKKYIENVRRIEKQKQSEQLKLQQRQQKTTQKKLKQKNEERLFDSIRNNIDDVTNTLPEPTQDELNIKPAVDIQPTDAEEKVLQPVNNKIENIRIEEIKPAVNTTQPTKDIDIPAADVKNQIPYEQTIPKHEEPKKHVPMYDWNLKNIYLEKIGRLSNLN